MLPKKRVEAARFHAEEAQPQPGSRPETQIHLEGARVQPQRAQRPQAGQYVRQQDGPPKEVLHALDLSDATRVWSHVLGMGSGYYTEAVQNTANPTHEGTVKCSGADQRDCSTNSTWRCYRPHPGAKEPMTEMTLG